MYPSVAVCGQAQAQAGELKLRQPGPGAGPEISLQQYTGRVVEVTQVRGQVGTCLQALSQN